MIIWSLTTLPLLIFFLLVILTETVEVYFHEIC